MKSLFCFVFVWFFFRVPPFSTFWLNFELRKRISQSYTNCERSHPGLNQLKCWPDEQRFPLQDRDHSRNNPRWAPGFMSCWPGMFPQRFRSGSVLCGFRRNSSSLDKAPKMCESFWLNSWESFIVMLLSISSSENWVMYFLALPGLCFLTGCSLRFLVFSSKLALTVSYFSRLT